MSETKTTGIDRPKKFAMMKQISPKKTDPTMFPAAILQRIVSLSVNKKVRMNPPEAINEIITKEISIEKAALVGSGFVKIKP